MDQTNARYRVAVDIGGTFTDLVMSGGEGGLQVAKVPSTPADYSAGVVAALETVLDDFADMGLFVHGTTAQLNAFLERKGVRTALLTTKGFGDVYAMGRGSRTRMYDLHYRNAEPLVPRYLIFEVNERLDAEGGVIEPLDEQQLPELLKALRRHDVESVALCFLHSYVNPDHEERVADFFRREAPDIFVSPSYRVCREWREFERTSTVVLNGYVSPILESYLKKLGHALTERGYEKKVYLMQSNGGLVEAGEAEARGVLTLMSGPVGGSVGSRALSAQTGIDNLICADMGGTSFDVSLILDGEAAVTSEKNLGGFPVLAPMVDLHTIGAGGGSVAWSDGGALRVGPRSAGAAPGPACYGRGGQEPTVTDANLVLGRIRSGALAGEMELHEDRAEAVIRALGEQFGLSPQKTAEGIIDVVNAQMANAIRSVTVSKGIDPRTFALVAFGGAGPMHAVFIARELGIERIIIPNVAGAFSAWGMLETDLRHDVSQTLIVPLNEVDWPELSRHFRDLEDGLARVLESEGVLPSDRRFARSLDLRYVGQEYFINVPLPSDATLERPEEFQLKELFDEMYERAYGHRNLAEEVELVNLRVEARGTVEGASEAATQESPSDTGSSREVVTRPVMFDGKSVDTRFYSRERLPRDAAIEGPLVIEEQSCTTVVPPGCTLELDAHGNLVLSLGNDT